MRLRLRLLFMFIKSLFKPKNISILDKNTLKLRVLPNDVDLKNMTNDRYLAVMDLGRFHLLFSYVTLPFLIKNKWIPVANSIYIQYRLPLKLFQKYFLHTQIIWWDNKHIYISQQFERKGKIMATAIVSANLMNKRGLVPTSELFSSIGQNINPPPQPPFLKDFIKIHAPHKIISQLN